MDSEHHHGSADLWMEQYLTLPVLKYIYWPIWSTIWAAFSFIWGLAIFLTPYFLDNSTCLLFVFVFFCCFFTRSKFYFIDGNWSLSLGWYVVAACDWFSALSVNTLRLRQNGRHFADNFFKCIFFNENVWILINISLKFVLEAQINNIPALVQIMAWPWSGDKPLSEPVIFNLLMHICVARPQWVDKEFGF